MTLIEVLAAVVIIGGSVTSILVAQSNSLDALRYGQLELTAQHLAKELITNWELEKADLRVSASGSVEDGAEWRWVRSVRQVRVMDSVVATEVRLVMQHVGDHSAERPWRREFVWLIAAKKET